MSIHVTQLSDIQQIIEYEFRSFYQYLHTSDQHFSDQISQNEADQRDAEEAITGLPRNETGEIDPDSSSFGRWEDLRTDSWLIGLEISALSEMRIILGNSSFVFLMSIF